MSNLLVAAVVNHLWQSTLFAALAASLVLLMRGNSARVRYLLWLAASLKFLVPFACLVFIGAQLPWPAAPAHEAHVSVAAGQMIQSIVLPGGQGASGMSGARQPVSGGTLLLPVVAVLWAMGLAVVSARWLRRWRALRREVQTSVPASVPFVIPVRRCSTWREPAVAGVWHPVLLLPLGLEQRLAPAELRAMLTHERCHVVWRDNLAAALHMLVEVIFWFYPLIWWLGARLVAERERACDEQVLAEGHAPRAYAEGILKVCEHLLQSRVPCAAAFGGASLKHRIEDIMKNRLIDRLSSLKKACIIPVAGGAVAAPVAVGPLNAPRARAQDASQEAGQTSFSKVSIQLATGGDSDPNHFSLLVKKDGKLEIHNATLRPLIAAAYNVQPSQVMGRQWSEEPRYNITADVTFGQAASAAAAFQDLLASRFGLVVKRELRQVQGYVLMLGAGGSKLKAAQIPEHQPRFMQAIGPESEPAQPFDLETGPAVWSGYLVRDMPMDALAGGFAQGLRVPVVNETGLQGDYAYTYRVNWQPGGPPDPAAIDKALQEQLGLHLEARLLNVDTIDVVSAKPPQEVLRASH